MTKNKKVKRLFEKQTFTPYAFHAVSVRTLSVRKKKPSTDRKARLEPAIRDGQKLSQSVFLPWSLELLRKVWNWSCLVPRPHFSARPERFGSFGPEQKCEPFPARLPRIRHWSELTEREWKHRRTRQKLVKLLAPCKPTQHCWPTTPNVVVSFCVRLRVLEHCMGDIRTKFIHWKLAYFRVRSPAKHNFQYLLRYLFVGFFGKVRNLICSTQEVNNYTS